MHVLEENWGEFLFNLGAEKSFLTRTQNPEAIKIKVDKFGPCLKKKKKGSITEDIIKSKDN